MYYKAYVYNIHVCPLFAASVPSLKIIFTDPRVYKLPFIYFLHIMPQEGNVRNTWGKLKFRATHPFQPEHTYTMRMFATLSQTIVFTTLTVPTLKLD